MAPLDHDRQHRDTLGAAIAASPEAVSCRPQRSGIRASCKTGIPCCTSWTLTLTLPAGQKVCAGHARRRTGQPRRLSRASIFPGRARGIRPHGRPTIDRRSLRGSTDGHHCSRTVFAPARPAREDYLDSVAGYIARCKGRHRPYPFRRLQRGFEPHPFRLRRTHAHLSRRIGAATARFIRHSSLGREVLHNWWKRRLSGLRQRQLERGLTTFMADYAYAQDSGADKAAEMRSGWLRDLSAIPTGQCDAPARVLPRATMAPRRPSVTAMPRCSS